MQAEPSLLRQRIYENFWNSVCRCQGPDSGPCGALSAVPATFLTETPALWYSADSCAQLCQETSHARHPARALLTDTQETHLPFLLRRFCQRAFTENKQRTPMFETQN